MDSLMNMFSWIRGDEVAIKSPEWLTSFQEDSPLLSGSQQEFISVVCSSIMRHTVQGTSQASKARVLEIKQNAVNIKENFQLVVDKLQMNASCREHFKENYPQWQKFRDMNIKHLMEVAQRIDTHRENCQVAKVIGSLASLIGGGICLASEDRENNPWRTIGSAMMGVGTMTSAGTSAVEEILLQENVDKAKKIMLLDEKHLKHLVEFLGQADSLTKAMDAIKTTGRKEDLVIVAEKFIEDVFNKNLHGRQRKREIEKVLNSMFIHYFPPQLREETADIVGILMSAIMLLDRFRPVFNLALSSRNVMSQLRLSADIFRAAYVGGNSVATFSQSQLTREQKMRVAGGMALDAFSILTVVAEDPKSVEGKEIRKVVAELQKESSRFQVLYRELKYLDINED